MKVFKFGGASVKDAKAIISVGKILQNYSDNIVVVVSALGKTTNLLEVLVKLYFQESEERWDIFTHFKRLHLDICKTLLTPDSSELKDIKKLFKALDTKLDTTPSLDYNFEYDQIICYGELVSTLIISGYLNKSEQPNKWIDIRTCLKTNSTYRDATVNWELTQKLTLKKFNFKKTNLYVTQGFVGSTMANLTTTLGREGSDYSAAILGNILNAENVTIWKDVPGVLNADPNIIEDAVKIDELSYREAVEMAYSGAKVIHPNTMKPLHNKDIPLLVKSFFEPEESGTLIKKVNHKIHLQPVFIFKEDQVLITLSSKDFSTIDTTDISNVFEILNKFRFKMNLIQQSAIDFSIVIDKPEFDMEKAIAKLQESYETKYNTNLRLITIRHYTDEAVEEYTKTENVYLEQKSRRTARIVVK